MRVPHHHPQAAGGPRAQRPIGATRPSFAREPSPPAGVRWTFSDRPTKCRPQPRIMERRLRVDGIRNGRRELLNCSAQEHRRMESGQLTAFIQDWVTRQPSATYRGIAGRCGQLDHRRACRPPPGRPHRICETSVGARVRGWSIFCCACHRSSGVRARSSDFGRPRSDVCSSCVGASVQVRSRRCAPDYGTPCAAFVEVGTAVRVQT